MDRRPAYGFSQKLRAAVEKPNITPSPLDYNADIPWDKRKGFSFGHRPRTNYVVSDQYDSPGPGEYYSYNIPFTRPRDMTYGLIRRKKRPQNNASAPLRHYDKTNRILPGNKFGTAPRSSTFTPKNYDIPVSSAIK